MNNIVTLAITKQTVLDFDDLTTEINAMFNCMNRHKIKLDFLAY